MALFCLANSWLNSVLQQNNLLGAPTPPSNKLLPLASSSYVRSEGPIAEWVSIMDDLGDEDDARYTFICDARVVASCDNSYKFFFPNEVIINRSVQTLNSPSALVWMVTDVDLAPSEPMALHLDE